MLIVIVEADPIVRIDMEETLRAQFAGAQIHCLSSVDAVEDVSADLLVVDTALDRKSLTNWLAQGACIISTDPDLHASPHGPLDGVAHLARPFSSDMLVQAVEQLPMAQKRQ